MSQAQIQSNYPEWRRILSLGERVMREDSLDAKHAVIVRTIEELLGCQADLWLRPESFSYRLSRETLIAQEPPSSLMQRACDQKQLIVEEFETEIPRAPTRRTRKKKNGKGYALAAPLLFNQDLLGALSIVRPSGPEFIQSELDFIDGLAVQCAFVLQAAHKIQTDQRRLELLELVRSVSAQIADVLDLDELARRITGLIFLTFRYYYVSIFTLEPNQAVLHFRGSAGPVFPRDNENPPDLEQIKSLSYQSPQIIVHQGEGIIGFVAQTGQEIIANDVSHDPHYRSMDVLPETQSEVAIPLKIEDRVLGVLDIQSDQLNAFDETDMLVLRALADHIATAIENARLYGDTQKRAEQLSLIAQVSNAITSILDLDDLLNEIVRLLHRQLGYPHVHVFMVHSTRNLISYQTGDEMQYLNQQGKSLSFELEDTNMLIPWVVQRGETVIISDLSSNDLFQSWNIFDPQVRSEIAVPLIFAGNVLGILDIQSDVVSAFGEDDRFLLETFAGNVAVSIRNANLYRSELWRRQVADSMREVAVLLTAEADLQQVLDLILQELDRTLACDYAAIWLVPPGETQTIESCSELNLAAVRLSEFVKTQSTITNEELIAEITQACFDITQEDSWLLRVLRTDSPLIRTSNMDPDPLAAYLRFPKDYSAITAPLRVADRPFGFLLLGHHTPGRYGHESQIMTATFASYAAVAIENTRLYEAAHDQAWISTVLLEVAEATQSLSNLDELLATVVRITPMLIGLSSCAIVLWDREEEMFFPTTAYGLTEDQMQIFQVLRVASGDEPAFDQLLSSRQAVFLSETVLSESVALKLLYNHEITESFQSVVIFPMMAHGELTGALLVAYQQTNDYLPASKNQNIIDLEDKFAIVQGIAQQTAVAVENIQLLKAQKEEAYVSVALLQVAQAIVSLNALDEILESIVRLTPILIGVKRCIIFLWDSTEEVFRVSQTYGLSRPELSELPETFRTEEFPLLEMVRQNREMAYHAYNAESESPLTWPSLTQKSCCLVGLGKLDENNGSPSFESEGSKEYLKLNSNLLYAYPLAVKGIVLGVMLTQEMEIAGAPSVHIREKRHEITIGITQQAALAIQNDLLQREVLERERLEREMQLAREIQQSFLPEFLPKPAGWDLDVRWKPAREVGGDFYDVIELPEDRLGIVIADVADKGMPAALYMTLIRTLIRATALETNSPAEVLYRVNKLLVAESKHSMFVTVAYAVVSIKSGQVVYANAGHNYPLFLSHTRQIERLPTTGMALGVLEESTFDELTFQLEPQDLIVFYTDGITEAFSTDFEMFGEDRLRKNIQRQSEASMSELLDAILDEVNEYTEGAPVSDDLTLVAFRYKKSSA